MAAYWAFVVYHWSESLPVPPIMLAWFSSSLLQTYFLPESKETGYLTKAEVLAQIDVAMGGRVAEELTLGPDNITTGAGQDMVQATELARRFCMSFSMSNLGLSSYAQSEPSEEKKAVIDKEVERILEVRRDMMAGL